MLIAGGGSVSTAPTGGAVGLSGGTGQFQGGGIGLVGGLAFDGSGGQITIIGGQAGDGGVGDSGTGGAVTITGGPGAGDGDGGDIFIAQGTGSGAGRMGVIQFVGLASGNIPSSNPPPQNYYLYVDPADNKLKAMGSSGTVTIFAVP